MKNKLLVICAVMLVVIIILSGFLGYLIMDYVTLDSRVKRAVYFMDEGKYEEAILEFEKAIKIEDRVPELYLAKANAEVKIKRTGDAIDTTKEAVLLLKKGKVKESRVTRYLDHILDGIGGYMTERELLMWWYMETNGKFELEELRNWVSSYVGSEGNTEDKEESDESKDTPETVEDESVYKEILENYRLCEENDYYKNSDFADESEMIRQTGVNPIIRMSSSEDMHMYYAVMDVNDDGNKELFISGCYDEPFESGATLDFFGNDYNIFDLFTICDGKAVRLIDPIENPIGYRVQCTVRQGGKIAIAGSGSAFSTGISVYELLSDSSELQEIDSAYQDTRSPESNHGDIYELESKYPLKEMTWYRVSET